MKLLKVLAAALVLVTGVGLVHPPNAGAVINNSAYTTTALGDSVTTNFTYPFIIPYQSNGTTPAVTVTLTTGGVDTILSPSLYSITGVNNPTGGYVHYPLSGSPLTSATTITITRSLSYTQPTAVPNTNFYPHTVEQIADKLEMQIQQLQAGGSGGGGGSGVTSLNNQTGAMSILAGSGVTVTPGSGTLTIGASGGGSGVSSFNTLTGAVTLAAGTNVTLGTAGNTVTVNAASSGGTQNVTYFTSISSLRANTSATIPNAFVQAYYSTVTGGGGNFYIQSSDTTSADNNCTVFVDAGSNRWYRSYNGPMDVRYCGAKGDGATNDAVAFTSAIAIAPTIYVPGNSTCYVVGSAITLTTGKTLFGDGYSESCIKASGNNYPVITTTNPGTGGSVYSLNKIAVKGLTLDRAVTAISGGDGVSFPYYVNNGLLSDLYITNQWNGVYATSTDYSAMEDVNTSNNYNNGVEITNSTYGPIQWYLNKMLSGTNNGYGFYIHASIGPALLPSTTAASSLPGGTHTELRTYANRLGGYWAVGLSTGGGAGGTDPVAIQSIRLLNGFFGEDGNSEIKLDTYSTSGHVLQPMFVELAGTRQTGRNATTYAASGIGSGIELTANNNDAYIYCGRCVNNSYDGIVSSAGYVVVNGGQYLNNGLAGFAGRKNGIYIFAGSGATISGIRSGNVNGTSGTQAFGVASTVDNVAMAACDLTQYASGGSYYAFSGGTTNVNIAGCIPNAANTASGGGAYLPLTGGTITGSLIVTGDTKTDTLHVDNASAFSGDLNVVGAHTLYANQAGGGVVANNLQAVAVAGSGGVVYGVDGNFSRNMAITNNAAVGGNVTVTGDVAAATEHITTSAIGSLNVTGSAAIAAGLQALDVYATRSAGVGVAPSGTAGQTKTTTLVASGAVSGTTGTFSGAVSGTTGTYSGALSAASLGTVGNLTAGSINSTTSIVAGTNVQATNAVYGVSAIFSGAGSFTGNMGAGSFSGGAASLSGTSTFSAANVSGTLTANAVSAGSGGFGSSTGSLTLSAGSVYAAGGTISNLSVPGTIYGPGGTPYNFP